MDLTVSQLSQKQEAWEGGRERGGGGREREGGGEGERYREIKHWII